MLARFPMVVTVCSLQGRRSHQEDTWRVNHPKWHSSSAGRGSDHIASSNAPADSCLIAAVVRRLPSASTECFS